MHSTHPILAQVREALQKAGLSQRAFARKHRVSSGYMARLLRGDFRPSARLAAILVDYMEQAGQVHGELERLRAERAIRAPALESAG